MKYIKYIVYMYVYVHVYVYVNNIQKASIINII